MLKLMPKQITAITAMARMALLGLSKAASSLSIIAHILMLVRVLGFLGLRMVHVESVAYASAIIKIDQDRKNDEGDSNEDDGKHGRSFQGHAVGKHPTQPFAVLQQY